MRHENCEFTNFTLPRSNLAKPWGRSIRCLPEERMRHQVHREQNDCTEELHPRKRKEAFMGVNSLVEIRGDPSLLNLEWHNSENPLLFIWERATSSLYGPHIDVCMYQCYMLQTWQRNACEPGCFGETLSLVHKRKRTHKNKKENFTFIAKFCINF